jgi:hypothetical protein
MKPFVMKKNPLLGRNAASWLCTLSLLWATIGSAVIPEPDNILYGTITLDNLPVTADHTNVVVEARRTSDGPAIASYRMGSDSQAGNFYSLRLPLESVAPVLAENASETGDALVIVLRDSTGIRGQTNFTFGDRGFVQRADFGLAVADGDADGLPDAWELARFGNLNMTPGSITPNGQTVLQHFIAGTAPNDPAAGFKLFVALTNNLKRVWFVAARAEGPGYEGLTRIYTLEYRPNLTSGAWTEVPGYINVAGSNQTVSYLTAGAGAPGFYRGRISLLGFTPLATNPPSVRLTITASPTNTAIVSWPSPAPGFILQQNSNLTTTNWSSAPEPITDDGTSNYVIVNPQSGSRFYRLFKP